MAQTMDYEVTSGEWVTVSEISSVFVQLKTNGPIIMFIGSAVPTETPYPGIVLEGNKLNAFALDSVEAADVVAFRAMDSDVERICLLTTASA